LQYTISSLIYITSLIISDAQTKVFTIPIYCSFATRVSQLKI